MTINTSCTLVEQLHESGKTDTLVEALSASGMRDELASGSYTVFAPIDSAFEGLPPGTLDGLLADRSALTSVLSYHVVPGVHHAADVVGSDSLPTLNGASLPVIVTAEGVTVGGARVIQTDVMSDNGVIHYIDSVLIPGS